ncbi:MAG: type II toxin-antitoxin system RelE/ParE family toxin [Candidatus Niyogibacteria bacterium]|nr:type II toxin-antitoxin system RelE/ParE family toxin [Candidatus Niyogibacteria bacterium]
MDSIDKEFARLTEKEKKHVRAIFVQLKEGDQRGLNVKKIKGREDVFRVRKGKLRVIYQLQDKTVHILAIRYRREDTYKF